MSLRPFALLLPLVAVVAGCGGETTTPVAPPANTAPVETPKLAPGAKGPVAPAPSGTSEKML